MTESTQDQISAFVDGELSADETEFLLRRLSHDSDARGHLKSYLAIGAALRGDLIADRVVNLGDAVSAALDGTDEGQAVAGPERNWWRIAKPVVGVAIAASVAISALLVVRDSGTGVPQAELSGPASSVAAYVVPTVVEDTTQLVRPRIRLTNYLVNHGQYASSLGRQRINSSVVAYEEIRETEQPAAEADGNRRE